MGVVSMIKKLIRGTVVCLFIFTISLSAFFISYKIAYRKSFNRLSETFSHSGIIPSSATENSNHEIINPDYFIARYNGTNLSVYAVSDGKEEFLYTLSVRIEDISDNELSELKKGVTLSNKQALASFEEDFTS